MLSCFMNVFPWKELVGWLNSLRLEAILVFSHGGNPFGQKNIEVTE